MMYVRILALLLVCHALADYPLQGDFLSRAKNRQAPIAGVPWWQAIGAHALIHGGMVLFVTNSLELGLFEFVCHFIIDFDKCRGKLTFNQDQLLHVVCKMAWVGLMWAGLE